MRKGLSSLEIMVVVLNQGAVHSLRREENYNMKNAVALFNAPQPRLGTGTFSFYSVPDSIYPVPESTYGSIWFVRPRM